MAEEEMIFDPNMKKKKKTKKAVDFNLLETDSNETTPTITGEKQTTSPNNETKLIDNDDLDDLNDLMNLKKKKKPKKKAFNLDELDSALLETENADLNSSMNRESTGESGQQGMGGGVGGAGTAGGLQATADDDAVLDDEDLEFNMTKKKKKKKRILDLDAEATASETAAGDEKEMGDEREKENDSDSVNQAASVGGQASWVNSDADYTYEELLQLVFSIIKEKNPDIMAGEKKRLVMRPPQVLRVGTKKTSFANFLDICKSLHRQPRHMQAFLLAELGTSGSVDANNQLIIKGRFQQKQIESVLKRYIKDYVACQTCRSPETILSKDTRLFFLQCESCGSRRSVASIKSGFQAVTSKRAALRAKDVKTN